MSIFESLEWNTILASEGFTTFLRILVVLALGLPLIKVLSSTAKHLLRHRLTPQSNMVTGKVITYVGLTLLIITVLRELKFDLTPLLGAAGIVGIAVGFAAQTSLSNLISGIFLIGEKPFEIGDLIKVGETLGFVLSIDLLSIKLRTFDNRFVRMPNETIIKTEVINVTRFPIRRLDINMGVAYKEDIRRVIDILKEVADKNPYCLDEPEPLVTFTGFGDSSLNIFMGVWFNKPDFLVLRNSLLMEIKERLDAEGIEIPFPHRTIYVGDVTKPFPLKMMSPEDAAEAKVMEEAE